MRPLRIRKRHRNGGTDFEVVRRSYETDQLVVLRTFKTEKSAHEWIGEVETRHDLLRVEDGEE